MNEETKGRIVRAVVPRIFLRGTLRDWYTKNPFHKFNKGDILILRRRDIYGYGIRPVAVVNGYELREDQLDQSGKYDLTLYRDDLGGPQLMRLNGKNVIIMYRDDLGRIFQWVRRNEVAQGVERKVIEHKLHPKWNIESQFRRARVDSVDEALALYRSREVEE